MDDTTDICVLCKEPLEEIKLSTYTLHQKGSDGINKASIEPNDTVQTVPGQRVHTDCCRIYCNPIKIDQAKREADNHPETDNKRCLLRSAEGSFSFSSDCFY